MDQPIDYIALERDVEANRIALGPGIPCMECSADIPSRFIFGKTIYHPEGRECGTQ